MKAAAEAVHGHRNIRKSKINATFDSGYCWLFDLILILCYKMKPLKSLAALSCAALCMVACTKTQAPELGGVTVDSSEITLEKGETRKLSFSVTPEGAEWQGVYWQSSDESVVTVDQDGIVTAVAVGTAEVSGWAARAGPAATRPASKRKETSLAIVFDRLKGLVAHKAQLVQLFHVVEGLDVADGAGLAAQIKAHSFERAYECVAHGNIKEDSFTISQPIGRNPKDRKKMAVTYKNSKPAVTHIAVLKRYGKFTHLRCTLETGRTHQIRVHLSYIGHPIAGDEVYGPKKPVKGLNGQCLHAKHIGFTHPITGKWLEFESELPEYFTQFLDKLEKTGFKP